MPRFTTSKPLLVRMMSTRFLPMSWTSPLTVASTTLPRSDPSFFSMCGSRCDTAAFITSALCSTSATISSLALKRRPTSAMPFISGPLMMSSGCGQRASASASSRSSIRPSFEPSTTERASRSSSGKSRRGRAEADALRPRKWRVKASIAAFDPSTSVGARYSSPSASRRSCSRDLGVARQPLGVDDRGVEPGLGGVVEEDRVEDLAAGGRQTEADVRDAEDGARLRHRLLELRAPPRWWRRPTRCSSRRRCRTETPARPTRCPRRGHPCRR